MPDAPQRKVKVACLLSGNGTTMSALLFHSRLPGCPYEIVLVASNRPDAPGLKIAEAEGIATFAHDHKGLDRREHEQIMDAALRESGAEYLALCGYMRILTEDFVNGWEGRMVNTHPSLLPKYKGLDTHQRAIDAGDKFGGCSIHIVTPELDGGPLLGQVPVAILPDDTAESLAARVILAEYQLYPRLFAEYVGRQYRADWLLETVSKLALAQPEAEERESHGSPGWHTGGKSGKFFAHFLDQHHGSEHIAVLVKTSGPDEVIGLSETAPETYFKPAYYGASGWVGIILNRPGVDWDMVQEWLSRSWRMVAPKRLTKLYDAADQF
ncbi:phosphoribosylglycinamide formyltransferase [Aurantiacibacter sp. MUD61]|uniref:phosphoribosylglycinamide formyltransferase n=1 Tax=Aurantiacibacter sp. MUD61 TaxID=3009083 RepID=UPI0022F0B46A|nr:phosphoribosylglycinamide formyltransferase [Aurantiacibacter sp. MUD61]